MPGQHPRCSPEAQQDGAVALEPPEDQARHAGGGEGHVRQQARLLLLRVRRLVQGPAGIRRVLYSRVTVMQKGRILSSLE